MSGNRVPLSKLNQPITSVIDVPLKFMLLWLLIRWLLQHWRVTLFGIAYLYLWITYDLWYVWVVLIIAGLVAASLLLAFGFRMFSAGWCGWKHLVVSMYRVAIVNLRWRRACYQAAVVGRRSSVTPKMRFIRVTPRGVEGMVFTGRLGIHIKTLDQEGATDALKASMAASAVRVKPINAGRGWVEIMWQDAVTADVVYSRQLGTTRFGEYKKLPFGIDDDGDIVSIAPDRSLLIVGESGSGKSSVTWALVKGMKTTGLPHKLHVLDPKGGVELSELEDYEHTVNYASKSSEAADVVRKVEKQMFKTYEWMDREGIRKIQICPERPLNVLIIDELLLLTVIMKEGIESPLGKLLTQGRAAGYVVWACSQLPQKDVVGPLRDLFVQRMCLAVRSASMTDAVLGDGAERDGAKCSAISLSTPGVGYMYIEGEMGYKRFRSVYIDDEEIQSIVGMEQPTAPLELPQPTVPFQTLIEITGPEPDTSQ